MIKPEDLDLRTKTLQPCFVLKGDMYVPHIRRNVWVTYGGVKTKTLKQLKALGAELTHKYLFEQDPATDWISGAKV